MIKKLFILLFLFGCSAEEKITCLDTNSKKAQYDEMLKKQQITADEYFSLLEDLKTIEKMKNTERK